MAFTTDTYILKGMRQDDSDLLFNGNKEGLSFAFENLNMRFTVDKSTTSLVATQEKGNRQISLYLTPKFFLNTGEITQRSATDDLPFVTIGTCVVDKYLVVFGKCIKTITLENNLKFIKGNDVIVRLEISSYNPTKFIGWIIYNGTELHFDLQHPLETLCNVETDIVKKVYFVDGINVPRSVNVVNKDAGQLANINLGYDLQLKDELLVEKNYNVAGKFPMGKVRFFYTYYNDEFSESNIVDWSPFFDCNYKNQGGGPDSQYVTSFAFNITIKNVDTQFKFIRVYMQHFTSNDATTYTLKYIERPLYNMTDFTTVFTFDQIDAKNSTITYLDMKLANYSFIPYTMAEKNNRMFYGNIKRNIPRINDLDLTTVGTVEFFDKEIGYEDLLLNRVYQYQPDNTTFNGSNFDYMGFRKDNWYRFGLIAQYKTGEWSDVMFICDKQCDRTSRTEIQYENLSNSQIGTITQYNPQPINNDRPPLKKPIRSVYYIPSARLIFDETALHNVVTELKQRGFKRIKPVCVVPPVNYRNVITQGISCSTLYTGGNRRNLSNNGLFAMPSYFFRPTPLYPVDETLINDYLYKPKYSFTLRSVSDLRLSQNIQTDEGWLLNPTFTNEQYAHYNMSYREYRHGFSLPPKDRINAELQSSDMSIHDYFYTVSYDNSYFNNQVSPLFSNHNGVNLFAFADNPSYANCFFKPYFSRPNDIVFNDPYNWINKFRDLYRVLPYHDLYTTGYDNTVFVDESICTLNSPEIDYEYSAQINPVYKNKDIKVIGYAQVTGSASDVDIPLTNYSTVISGECLYNIDKNRLDNDTQNYIASLGETLGICNQVLPFTCGPWWLDTMRVDDFIHVSKTNLYEAFNKVTWFSLLTGLITPELGAFVGGIGMGTADNLDQVMFGTQGSPQGWQLRSENRYNLKAGDDTKLRPDLNCIYFCRDIDPKIKEPRFKSVTSFYGELDGKHIQDGEDNYCEFTNHSVYPYSRASQRMFVFSEFVRYNDYTLRFSGSNIIDSDTFHDSFYKWASIPLTWNTVGLTFTDVSDVYWDKFDDHRRHLEQTILPYNGDVTLPKSQNGIGFLGDMSYTLSHNDARGLFSYYFFPYYTKNKPLSFYSNPLHTTANHFMQHYLVKHPWLLPLTNRHDWASESDIIFNGLNSITECDTPSFHSNIIPYDEGSEYGCHYYAPFSTNFTGGYFEPYYAHVVYPFMNNDTNIPFCGSRDFYKRANVRPAYNSTHSHLYSCCTNYIENTNTTSGTTYSAFYHSPNLTQLYLPEPDLSSLPFIVRSNTTITKLYSYDCSDSAGNPNIPILRHRTETLTAAMKWYRGFKHLASSEELVNDQHTKLISTGCYLNKESLMGNLMFSGWLPQFFTKNGLLQSNLPIVHLNYITTLSAKKFGNDVPYAQALRDFLQVGEQSIDLHYNSCPHIVYCNQPTNNSLELLPKFKTDTLHLNLLDNSVIEHHFKPQFYYKEFINELVYTPNKNEHFLDTTNVALNWMYSTYPHTGHFEEFQFDELKPSKQPYWNKNKRLSGYPELINEVQLTVNDSEDKLVKYDKFGYIRQKQNYWLLPISNMYDNKLIQEYTEQNCNPYTLDNVSVEQWNWKICGNTINIDNVSNDNTIQYLEGDTYFQRYNCLKTISSDTLITYLNSDTADNTNIGNDVTETASVMLESYTNLDGLYWDYDSIIDKDSSPLLHPFYNHINKINPVYSIQNDLCDSFKQVDSNYYDVNVEHYPTQIVWSAQKQDGENVDNWGIVPITNKLLIGGEMGVINKLISYRDQIYCLQEHGLSVLNYNSKVIEPTNTNSTLSLYLSDATRLQDVTYLSRNIGTLNKWSVAIGQRGFYWIDDTLQQFYRCGESDNGFGIEDMSNKYGFKSWSNAHISSDNCLWDINTFLGNTTAFKANYDLNNGDVYWANGEWCICFNELLDCFTSFYSYETIPYKFNYTNRCYSINNSIDKSSLWEDYVTYEHKLYEQPYIAYIDLLVNPIGQYDKVFNFIEYNTDSYYTNSDFKYEGLNPYTHLSVYNRYQYGNFELNKTNTKNRFNLWRSDIPREIKNDKYTMNRIRSPWCHIKLEFNPRNNHYFNPNSQTIYRDKLYYINVNYTIPEQPIKTNTNQQ